MMAVARAAGGAEQEVMSPADIQNVRICWWLGYTWAATVAALLVHRMWLTGIRYVRTLACLENEKQQYFITPHSTYAKIKRHVLDAPFLRKRHNREFALSNAVNMGTLPGRLQMMYLVGYVAMNIVFCVYTIDWSAQSSTLAGQVRNRTGVLSVMNMLPLFLLAGRNNPLIRLLDISFDTYNLMHRQIGRIVVFEAVAHTLAWMVNTVNKGKGQRHITQMTIFANVIYSWLGCRRRSHGRQSTYHDWHNRGFSFARQASRNN